VSQNAALAVGWLSVGSPLSLQPTHPHSGRPLFVLGNIGLILGVLEGSPILGAVSLATMIISVALQGRRHKREQVPPEP
jgi:hypothetical protein